MNCYQAFKRSGGDVRVPKSFGNVIHEPIITGSSGSLILELINLLLGVLNHLYKSLKNVWPKASQWPAALHIDEEPFHGEHFAGNQCYKLLNNLDLLQHLAEKDSAFQAFWFCGNHEKISSGCIFLLWHKTWIRLLKKHQPVQSLFLGIANV